MDRATCLRGSERSGASSRRGLDIPTLQGSRKSAGGALRTIQRLAQGSNHVHPGAGLLTRGGLSGCFAWLDACIRHPYPLLVPDMRL